MTDHKKRIELTIEAFRKAEEASDTLFNACHDAKGVEGTLEAVFNGERGLTAEDVLRLEVTVESVRDLLLNVEPALTSALIKLAALRRELAG